jgi:nucleoside-diphosphate-sugar epimerase
MNKPSQANESAIERNGTVVVDGATGYVGSHITAALRNLGYKVRCLVRPRSADDDIALLKSTGAQVFQGLLGAPDSQAVLTEAFRGAGTAVHTIGSVAPKRGETLTDLHIHQTASFIDCCKRNGVERVIMISSLGTRANANAEYHKTKWLAEQVFRESGLSYVILRPALILGRTFGQRNSKLVARYLKLIKEKSTVPLIAGGANIVQPIFIDDVVKSVVETIARPVGDTTVYGQSLNIAGPEQLTMRQFVERLAQEVVGEKRDFKAVSPGLVAIAAIFCELFQDVPMVSKDQIKLALENNGCSDNALEPVLQIKPTSLANAFASYKQERIVSETGARQEVS